MSTYLFRLLLVVTAVLFFVASCEEPDTTAPEVTVTNPAHETTISEVVNVTCVASDNVGIEKVELWIGGVSTGLTDDTEPYSFSWNTTEYDDGSTQVITVRAYDASDNTGDSNPVTVIIDQTDAYPEAVNITSVTYDVEAMTISWEKSPDTDFGKYELYKGSDTTNFELLATIEDQDTLTYSMIAFDPLVDNYFRVMVYDTLGLNSTGDYLSNDLHTEPNTVNVTEVSYTLSGMTIRWEVYEANLARIQSMLQKMGQKSSVLNGTDFISYELLSSETEDGEKTSITTITVMDTTSYTLTDFDPTHENWYWVKITDFWGLTSTGTGQTNTIDSDPSSVNVTSVDYTLTEMTVAWPQSSDADFVSYELLYSEAESGTQSSLGVFDDITLTSFTITDFDPTYENWFWIKVTDFWGLTSTGVGLTNAIDSPPTVAFLDTIDIGADSYTICWSQNFDIDFSSYKLFESFDAEMNSAVMIYSSNTTGDTSFINSDLVIDEYRYYQIITHDYWGLTASSNIEGYYISSTFYKIYGGEMQDVARSVQQLSDGQFIITGSTGGDGVEGGKVSIMQTDILGNENWSVELGVSGTGGHCIQQTVDGGYIITGYSGLTYDPSLDVCLIKTDTDGNPEWWRVFGGSEYDIGNSVQLTSDGGYILVGSTSSFGNGSTDVWLIKTDADGNELWSRTFGGSEYEQGESVQLTSDGGYILVGSTSSFGNGSSDVWLIKTDADGNELWNRAFGGSESERGNSVQLTSDGGYILVGSTSSFGNGSSDVWLIKTGADGNELWNRTIGESSFEGGYSVQLSNDGGYILAGYTNTRLSSFWDALLIKTDSEGNVYIPD